MSHYRLSVPVMVRTKRSGREVVLPAGTEVDVPVRAAGPAQFAVVEPHTRRVLREFGTRGDLATWLRRNTEPNGGELLN